MRAHQNLLGAFFTQTIFHGCFSGQDIAAPFNFDKARIFTRTLAGLAGPFIISPVAGVRVSVPGLRAGSLRKVIFNMPGKVNSPTPRGCIDPNITDSRVLKTPIAVLRGMSFCSAIRLISADLVSVCLIARADVTGLTGFCLAIISPVHHKTSEEETSYFIAPMLAVLRDLLQYITGRKERSSHRSRSNGRKQKIQATGDRR